MAAAAVADKPHVVCIPYPHQSHIKVALTVAKLLHHKGFHITFVNTEFNHKRILRSRGSHSLDGLPDFRFETIPDGLPPSDLGTNQDTAPLSLAIRFTLLPSFRNLIATLNHSAATSQDTPPVTSILSDGFMPFTIAVAHELSIPIVLLWTLSACGFMAFYELGPVVDRGLGPLKDASYLTNGYLDDTVLDWVPGMKDIRLKHLPTFIRGTDPNDSLLNLVTEAPQRAHGASAMVFHTFDALEAELLGAMSSMFPPIYTIGPLQLLMDRMSEKERLDFIGYNMWKEEPECLQWLDSRQPNSVIYVNFGSIVVMSPGQAMEFGWGLANSNHDFLWVVRHDLISGDSAVLSPEFMERIKGRGYISGWCPQEQVLNHPSIGGFLTHSGWNSTIESLSAGLPMICWPVIAEQPMNCLYSCREWGVGMELSEEVTREEVERLVRELMGGEEGRKMKKKAAEWKKMAEEATAPDGSSSLNLDRLANVLLSKG